MRENGSAGGAAIIRDPANRWPRDIVWAIVMVAISIVHFGVIFYLATPYWLFTFPLPPPLAAYLWSIVAIVVAMVLIRRAVYRRDSRRRQKARVSLSVVLCLLAVDVLTGGDRRWFEVAMRLELRRCGGATALQEWVEGALTSQSEITRLEAYGGSDCGNEFPPRFRKFVSEFSPRYFKPEMGGPFILFVHPGLVEWGIIVGKRDLDDPGASLGAETPGHEK